MANIREIQSRINSVRDTMKIEQVILWQISERYRAESTASGIR